MRNRLLIAVAAVALSLPVSTQTFIVDASGGPGAHFTDLPTAVSTVPDGAILLVRPGAYGPVALDGKGLSILATAPGVVIDAPSDVAIAVQNLAAHQSFTLREVRIGSAGIFTRMLLRDCVGPVLVDGYTVRISLNYSSIYSIGIEAERCAQVSVRNSHIEGWRGIRATDSDCVLENCDVIGNTAYFLSHIGAYSGTGAELARGSLVLSRCRMYGGDGLYFNPISIVPASPAITIHGGTLRLCEDSSGLYAAGQVAGGTPLAAIGGSSGTVIRDPSPTLTGGNGGPAVDPNLTDTVRPLPSLRTTSAPPGGTVTADVTTPIAELVLLAVALPGPTTTVAGIDGAFWLDPATAQLAAVGVPQPGAPLMHSIGVPNWPSLIGARFAWQAVAWSATDGFRVSNPSTYAH